ncbi:Flagellar motor rotation protein MotB [Acidisarcina polymorpha]|uniref:Flagellar motor rotation protein MotB n=1 Tax=Acidisarcina polymorpha TaxID=2211140 RepID=A0A2Z5G6W1_9BACT|nr:flagellar motor protein MotB [Acidisarcina polymorpha]AXC14831.1 Flagellar motor rotation protein MotB [Acidisarcina polymorpha]
MMRRKKNKPHVNHERWLVSYADFITLMFAFFVVMYATSKADVKKQVQMADSIDSAFRTLGLFQQTPTKNGAAGLAHNQEGPVTPMNIVSGEELMAPPAVKVDLEKLKERLSGMLSTQIAEHVVSMKIGRDGLVISLREAGFYDSGSAAIHTNSLPVLNRIATALASSPYDIRIEGHTDNVPIHTEQFDSNWELSTSRATRLTRIFVADSFAPYRLSASGYAEFHPVAPNDTADGRSQNRRVDIIVLPRTSSHPELSIPTQVPVALAGVIHHGSVVSRH